MICSLIFNYKLKIIKQTFCCFAESIESQKFSYEKNNIISLTDSCNDPVMQ